MIPVDGMFRPGVKFTPGLLIPGMFTPGKVTPGKLKPGKLKPGKPFPETVSKPKRPKSNPAPIGNESPP